MTEAATNPTPTSTRSSPRQPPVPLFRLFKPFRQPPIPSSEPTPPAPPPPRTRCPPATALTTTPPTRLCPRPCRPRRRKAPSAARAPRPPALQAHRRRLSRRPPHRRRLSRRRQLPRWRQHRGGGLRGGSFRSGGPRGGNYGHLGGNVRAGRRNFRAVDRAGLRHAEPLVCEPALARVVKLSQVNTLPKAKSQTRSKQDKDMHKFSSVYSERGVPLPILTSGGE